MDLDLLRLINNFFKELNLNFVYVFDENKIKIVIFLKTPKVTN